MVPGDTLQAEEGREHERFTGDGGELEGVGDGAVWADAPVLEAPEDGVDPSRLEAQAAPHPIRRPGAGALTVPGRPGARSPASQSCSVRSDLDLGPFADIAFRPVSPIVFLPGAGGRSTFWRPVAERLADLGPGHLLGYPGFGENPPAPAIRSLDGLFDWLVSQLPPGRFHLLAQSMGGVLAARLALEQPERVERLVLAATSGGTDMRALGASDWRPEYLAALPGVPRWFAEDRTDLTSRLGAIRAPTLLLWSDADPVSPLSVGRFLQERIAGSRLAVFAGGSHAFAEERSEEVAAEVRSHLLG